MPQGEALKSKMPKKKKKKIILTCSRRRMYGREKWLIDYLFRATPMAHGGSQASGRIGTVVTGLHHSHSIMESEPHLRLHHSSWQCQILNPLSKARDRTCIFMDACQIVSAEPRWGLWEKYLLNTFYMCWEFWSVFFRRSLAKGEDG